MNRGRDSTAPRPQSQMSRPAWPWSPYSHGHNASTSSFPGASSGSPSGSGFMGQGNWVGSHISHAPVGTQSTGTSSEIPVTRHWTFTAFEWTIEGISLLRDVIEHNISSETSGENTSERGEEDDVHPALKEAPMLGDGRFMLEIARTQPPESGEEHNPTHLNSTTPKPFSPSVAAGRTLSISITSLVDSIVHPGSESATLMAAIKSHETSVGERGARSEWVWEVWDQFTFRKNSEVWECPLPSLSILLGNPRINASDSFVLCIQIHTPVGKHFPHHPSAYYVPRSLLEGIENSLDNSHTGDVRFICVERMPQSSSPPGSATGQSRSSSDPSFALRPQLVRKRILFGHSDILKKRSEYFNTMLTSLFAEGDQGLAPGERRVHDVVVEEADFVTMYWLLKWIYANWLLFKEEDDPRDAVTAMGAGWSANWLTAENHNEWDVTTLIPNGAGTTDNSSVASNDSEVTTPAERTTGKARVSPSPSSARSTVRTSHPTSSQTLHPAPVGGATIRRPSPNPSRGTRFPDPPGFSPVALSHQTSTRTPVRQPRPIRSALHPASDPHPHPTPAPPPASALSVYLVAHRYGIDALASLAVEHTMKNVSPRTAFPLLLATQFFSELRALLEDYIVDHWGEVSSSQEFDVCCQEIAAGDWVSFEGGATLAALFRRLHRPALAT